MDTTSPTHRRYAFILKLQLALVAARCERAFIAYTNRDFLDRMQAKARWSKGLALEMVYHLVTLPSQMLNKGYGHLDKGRAYCRQTVDHDAV